MWLALESDSHDFLSRALGDQRLLGFDISVAFSGGSLPEGLSAVRVNTRELEGSSLAVMQQKGRTLPVAAARFLSQIMEQLAQEEVGVTLA